MEAKFLKQGARDLEYKLFSRSVHPELFQIIEKKDIEEKSYKASLWIVDSGHIVTFRSLGKIVSEVVINRNSDLPRFGIQDQFKIASTDKDTVYFEDWLRYRCTFSIETYAPDEFEKRTRDILMAERKNRIQVLFLRSPKENHVPFILMDYRPFRKAMEVLSIHSFPKENAIIYTQTLMETGLP
jgi:hypothetical protein